MRTRIWKQCAVAGSMVVLATVLSCRHETAGTTAESLTLKPGWQLALPADTHLYPLRQGNRFLFSWHAGQQQCFASVGIRHGKVKARWCCPLATPAPLYYNLLPVFAENKWLLPAPGGILIPNEAEQTCQVWATPFEASEAALTEQGGTVYRVYYQPQYRKAFVTAFNTATDSLRSLVALAATDSASIFLKNPFLYRTGENRQILVVGYTRYFPASRKTLNGVLRIALPEGQILSDLPLSPPNHEARGLNQHPVSAGQLSFWTVQQELICYDHARNHIRWRRQMPAPMVTSRLLAHDGSLYFAAEDGLLYALAMPSGALRWKAAVSGSPGRVFVAGKFLFLVGGADGLLYGIRRNDGAVVLKKRSDRHNIPGGIYYQRTCYADEDGLLLFDGKNWEYYRLQ